MSECSICSIPISDQRGLIFPVPLQVGQRLPSLFVSHTEWTRPLPLQVPHRCSRGISSPPLKGESGQLRMVGEGDQRVGAG